MCSLYTAVFDCYHRHAVCQLVVEGQHQETTTISSASLRRLFCCIASLSFSFCSLITIKRIRGRERGHQVEPIEFYRSAIAFTKRPRSSKCAVSFVLNQTDVMEGEKEGGYPYNTETLCTLMQRVLLHLYAPHLGGRK